LETARPGRVETQIHLFLDDVGLRELVVTVRGEGVRQISLALFGVIG
jgi:hypothetical protein